MRLTLRTLLAYVDDILDSSDKDELRKKVEGSEFATDLLHKTRDTMRRLRLGAPPVLGGDGALDPNTVAEYLDNTLPPEQVGDFERVCLESDIHLAEVGSCHQILTMVLGEPAEIDSDSRQRIYDLPHPEEKVPEQQATAHDVAIAETEAALPRAKALVEPPQVPDYLRETFFQRYRGTLAIAGILLLVSVGVFIAWPTDPTPVPPEMGGERGLAEATTEPQIEEDDDPIGASVPALPAGAMDNGGGDPADSEPPPFVPGPTVGDSAIDEMTPPAGDTPDTSGTTESDAASDGTPADRAELLPNGPLPDEIANVIPPITPVEPENGIPGDGTGGPTIPDPLEPGSESGPPAPADPTDNGGASSAISEPMPQPPNDGAGPDSSTAEEAATQPLPEGSVPATEVPGGVAATGTPDNSAEPAAPPVPAAPALLATYLASNDVLLQYDTSQTAWIRLIPRAKLFADDLLLAAPAYRSTIALASGIQVKLDGGTRVKLIDGVAPESGEGEAGQTGLEIIYGRVIIDNPMLSTETLTLRFGGMEALVRFDGVSTLAIEVHHTLPPGADPLSASAIVTADFYATSGHLLWSQGDRSLEIAPSSTWQLTPTGTTPPAPLETLDGLKWIDGAILTFADRNATPKLSDAFEPGLPIHLRLSELNDDRSHREIRSLAGRISVHVGQFEPFVKTLNDSDQRAVWDEHIATLKSALALSPAVASQVREAFRRQKGESAGDKLFRMLWGYSEEDLQQGTLADLVHGLDNESLDYRVLAFYNLHQLTGKKLGGYRPQDSLKARQQAVRIWTDRLNKNELLP